MSAGAGGRAGDVVRAAHAAVRAGETARAVELFAAASELAPGRASVRYNLGTVLLGAGRPAEALAALRAAVQLDPERAEIRATLAQALLATGDEREGWEAYLWRREAPRLPAERPRAPLPERLEGEHVALLNEQGLGDALFFLRYAGELARRGARVVHDPLPKLAPLIARVPGLGRPVRVLDRMLPLGDLPFLVEAHRRPPPPPLPLAPAPDRLARAAARLAAAGPSPWLAVTWQAGLRRPGALLKELPPAILGRVVAGWPGTVIVLQRGARPADVAAFQACLGRPAADFGDLHESLDDMLATLAVLDEYVAVSNTNVHLRAGAGRPSRVLVPWPPEFRWRAGLERSPWFPDHPLLRQASDGGWEDALAVLARDLSRPVGA